MGQPPRASEHDLRSALQTAFVHCRPGGAALFAPDHVRETFRPQTDCGGTDEGERALRYLEWTWDPASGSSPGCRGTDRILLWSARWSKP